MRSRFPPDRDLGPFHQFAVAFQIRRGPGLVARLGDHPIADELRELPSPVAPRS